uniref:Reverse transcriptase domain-containing protein n=1 Tax=Tanacetum cinerariifolium TaxID=118510 RepID=A0A6L2P6N1_TANCI|nr:hypothetical protein [Tanacetum cinerariifolium]
MGDLMKLSKINDEVFQANHSVQNEESLENSSNEIAISNSNQKKEEPPQDSDIRQLIREECCVEASEEQKQSMEDTMLELVKFFQEKEFLCIHDNVDNLIESALNTKLLSINSQRLEKKQQEIKNVIEQQAERGNQLEHSLSMGYEHLIITPETESDEVTESNAENLLPIPSECEVTSEDESKCDVPISENSPICDDHFEIFSDSKNDDDISVYEDDFEDIEYIEPDQERLINLVKNDIFDNSSNDPLLEEADLFLAFDNLIPPGIENVANESEGDVRFLEDLLIDDSILSHESSDFNFEDNPPIPRPPPEPPDAKTDKVFSFIFAEIEDTIFDPGISI